MMLERINLVVTINLEYYVSHPSLISALYVFTLLQVGISTVEKYTASIFRQTELVILTTISLKKCCPPASIFGIRGDEKQLIDLEYCDSYTVSSNEANWP